MPKAADSAITRLLKLCDQLTPAERQAGIDILRHAGRQTTPKAPLTKKARQKAPQSPQEGS